ncbi:hypothetical protein EDB92DRAFT_484339 [Lactarius akahatsu]|uniref:HNH nuclease domain-containing protein n=1 Tax=Lactarius akahatsu TaxID=416441 RepID=A0AAD4LUS7_9AGAM|nr:hypothetical protein EDB92DRAFT_484339 [Lactarius akahatsu]
MTKEFKEIFTAHFWRQLPELHRCLGFESIRVVKSTLEFTPVIYASVASALLADPTHGKQMTAATPADGPSSLLLLAMPRNRAPVELERNVHFVDADNDEIGGLCQNGSVTWAEISEWMQIVYMLPFNQYATFPCLGHGDPEDPVGQHGAPINMQANTDLVQPGYCVVLSPEGLPVGIPINDEGPIPRAATRSLSKLDPRSKKFRRLVRERDRHCVVTRTRNFRFIGLETAHIFPVAHLDLWRSGSWQQHITDDKYDG